jgi:hypothetical protein
MGDAPPRMDRAKYKATLKKTRESTAKLIEDDVAVDILRNLGFRLPRASVDLHLRDLPVLSRS